MGIIIVIAHMSLLLCGNCWKYRNTELYSCVCDWSFFLLRAIRVQTKTCTTTDKFDFAVPSLLMKCSNCNSNVCYFRWQKRWPAPGRNEKLLPEWFLPCVGAQSKSAIIQILNIGSVTGKNQKSSWGICDCTCAIGTTFFLKVKANARFQCGCMYPLLWAYWPA